MRPFAVSSTLLGSGTVLALLLLVTGGANIGAAEDQAIQVVPLPRDGFVFVTFVVNGAVDSEIEQTIQSGLPTTFAYDVELRRTSALWFDRSIGSVEVAATVRYDNLTRRYQISLQQDGRVLETKPTDKAEEVKQIVSTFHRLPLFTTRQLHANTEYYIRVQGRTRPRRRWAFLFWDPPSAFGSAKFTFLR
jgi:hypothetical protein